MKTVIYLDNMANKLAKPPTHKLAKAPCRVAPFQYSEQK